MRRDVGHQLAVDIDRAAVPQRLDVLRAGLAAVMVDSVQNASSAVA